MPGSVRQPEHLLLDELETIERAIRFACRRNGLLGAEAEDFASIVKLRLIENDYAILRSFESRSRFATFIAVVIERMVLDLRVTQWGKWHPSAQARRMGDLAVAVERLLVRDGRSIDEVVPILAMAFPSISRDSVTEIANQLPERAPRRRAVALEEAESVSTEATVTEQRAVGQERRQASERLSAVMQELLDRLGPEDQTILRLRFECGMTVAQIARSLHVEQKLLYRRMDRQLRELRADLVSAGIEPAAALDLLGQPDVTLEFTMESAATRPSENNDGAETAAREESL